MPAEPVLTIDGAGVIRTTDPNAPRRLVEEAKLMLSALVVVFREPLGAVIQSELGRGSLLGVDLAREAIWLQVREWLFDLNRVGWSRLEPGLSELETALRRDEPWTEAIAPLASRQDARLTWTWRLIAWIVLHAPDLPSDSLYDQFEEYCRRHETPVRWDYVVEARFLNAPDGARLLDRLAYRRAEWEDGADIVVRWA